jgi:hypothetical protein
VRAQKGASVNPSPPTPASASTNASRISPALLSDEDLAVVEQQLLTLQSWIQSVGDDPDAQLQAIDLVATNNFVPAADGATWHLKKTPGSGSPATSTSDLNQLTKDLKTLRRMNSNQHLLNAYTREAKRLKLELFSAWWKYVVDRDLGTPADQAARRTAATSAVSTIVNRIRLLGMISDGKSLIRALSAVILRNSELMTCQAGIRPTFYTQRDPTLLFAGVPSNRDTKLVGKNIPVRVEGQETLGLGDPSTDPNMASWTAMNAELSKEIHGKVPAELETAMQNVVAEAPWILEGKPGTVAPYGFLNGGVFDNSNGWYPLFFEWSAEYYHIPFTSFDFIPRGAEAKVQYGIVDAIDLSATKNQDFIVLSGRSPVLPQVSASLQTVLKQLFSKMNPTELDGLLPPVDRQPLLDSVTNLQYLSAAMNGFARQLTTRMQGAHVKPNSLPDGGTPTALKDALAKSAEIGMDASQVELMDLETQFTPFASLVDIPADPTQFSPFKPVTHGQFTLTKLQILDRFGQLVTSHDLLVELTHANPTPTPIFPCLGDAYSLQALPDGTANAVLHRADQHSCFVQIPPTINQPSRINAEFVVPTPSGWRPLDEWENPVCGWLVVSLPNFSIQMFDARGHFLREFSFMDSSPACRPFAPVPLPPSSSALLIDLVAKLADPGYAQGLFTTLADAAESVKHPPTQYAEAISSAFGKPFALVQMGFSLELMDPPLTNESTISPSAGVVSASVTDYHFPVKLGDGDNTFDGLAGYLDLKTSSSDPHAFELGSFYSEFAADQPLGPSDPSKPIKNFMTLQPFFVPAADSSAADYAAARHSHLSVIAGLIDPFVAVHAYTQLLPLKQLKLPQWVVSEGINRISAAFRIGPLLVPGDVPALDKQRLVSHDYVLDEDNKPATTGSIPMPNFDLGDWVWLQPFWDTNRSTTEYNFVDVGKEALKPRFEPLPYSAVEGFLQMKNPFGTSGKSDTISGG